MCKSTEKAFTKKGIQAVLLFSSILSHIQGDSSKYGNLYETLEDIRDSINSTIENEILASIIRSDIPLNTFYLDISYNI